MRGWIGVGTFLLWTAASAPPASAQPPAGAGTAPGAAAQPADPDGDPLARNHFASGRAYYDRGRYEEAIVEFQRAYELSPHPELLYNLYLAHQNLGHRAEAIDALSRYLAERPDERPELRERLRAMRERLEQEPEPTREPAPSPEPTPAPRAAPAPRGDPGGTPTGAVVSLIAGGVGLLAFGAFGSLALVEDGRLAGDCGADVGATCTEDDLDTLHTYALIADVSLGVGLVAGAIGLIWLLTGGDDGAEAPLALGPHGAVLRVEL